LVLKGFVNSQCTEWTIRKYEGFF